MSRAGNRRPRGSRPSTERGRVDNHWLLPANQRSPIGQGRCDCPSLIAKKREAPSGLPCSTRHPLKKAVTKDNKSLLCSRYRWRWCNANFPSNQANPSHRFYQAWCWRGKAETLGWSDCLLLSQSAASPSTAPSAWPEPRQTSGEYVRTVTKPLLLPCQLDCQGGLTMRRTA